MSSRELEGKLCQEYTSGTVTYSNLSPKDLGEIHDVSCWILALPNGVCKPFVEVLKKQQQKPPAKGSSPVVVVDLSADFRFDDGWAYGLPELYQSRDRIRSSQFISNPGCYATGAQLSLAPLAPFIAPGTSPVIVGISGYSGAGNKRREWGWREFEVSE